MALVNVAKIEAYLLISQVLAGKVVLRLAIAEIYLRNLKGDTWYDDLVALDGSDPGGGSLTRAEEAEALLAFYFALPFLNTKLEDDGGMTVVAWTDDGSTKVQLRFATMRSLEMLRAEVLSQAKTLIAGDVMMEYGEESTLITSVGDVSPLSGLTLTALVVD